MFRGVVRRVVVGAASATLVHTDRLRDQVIGVAVKVVARYATLEERMAVVQRRLATNQVVAVVTVKEPCATCAVEAPTQPPATDLAN